jgi:hypothetical protein
MKYINKTKRWDILQRSPVDDRLIISTEQEIAILQNKEPMPDIRISTRSYMATGHTYP